MCVKKCFIICSKCIKWSKLVLHSARTPSCNLITFTFGLLCSQQTNKYISLLPPSEPSMFSSLVVFFCFPVCNHRLLSDRPASFGTSDIHQNQLTHQWFRQRPLAGAHTYTQTNVFCRYKGVTNEASQRGSLYVCVNVAERERLTTQTALVSTWSDAKPSTKAVYHQSRP